jgi:hypothetical protein
LSDDCVCAPAIAGRSIKAAHPTTVTIIRIACTFPSPVASFTLYCDALLPSAERR